MQKIKINTLLIGLAAVMTACSFVSLTPQANSVTVSPTASAVSNCKFVGNTNVSLWSSADTFQSNNKTESQLDTLARNQAATMGGNAVVATTKTSATERTYGVYNCPTN